MPRRAFVPDRRIDDGTSTDDQVTGLGGERSGCLHEDNGEALHQAGGGSGMCPYAQPGPSSAWEQSTLQARGKKSHAEIAWSLTHMPSDSSLPSAVVLEPGLVLIKGALALDVQQRVASLAWSLGHVGGGFYDQAQGGLSLNSTVSRGRIYDAIEHFPQWLIELCAAQVHEAQVHDPYMPHMVPTHLLLLYYASDSGIGWHRDDGENDGIGEEPVVSLSVGDSCNFAFRHDPWDEARVVRLDSGDAILFGGPCRRVLHAVTAVHVGTGPIGMPAPGCFNLTFRSAPNILGREKDFEHYKPGQSRARRKAGS